MYQLTDANLNQISAWFHQDVPCKNGVSVIDLIKSLSAENVIANIATESSADVATAEATVEVDVQISE
jgi:hypothetical protein